MKKVLIIAIAAMCVMSCGQRRAAKSQESEKASCPKDTMEVVEHSCCGHHGEGGCEAGKLERVCDEIEKAADAVEQAAETAESKGVTVVKHGKKADPKPIKPVPNPYKK